MEGRRFPREFLIAEIKRVARIVGDLPTRSQFGAHSKVAPVTLEKRFKGWKNALASAGFDPSIPRLTYSQEDLKNELLRVAKLLGHTPTTTEFSSNSSFSATTVTSRLGGSWLKACQSAGLSPSEKKISVLPNPRWRIGKRKLQISRDELLYMYETEGLSAAAIAKRHDVSSQSVLRCLREHGIKVKRLHYAMPRETTPETMLYQELERRSVPFARQQVVDGRYLVDALIMNARIVIECDGDYWHSLEGRPQKDAKRQKYLESRGYFVLRFSEAAIRADVRRCGEMVVEALFARIKKSSQ